MDFKIIKENWKIGLKIVIGVVVVGLLGYFGWQYINTQELLKNPTAAAIKETNDLVRLVGKHVTLPAGEMPTIATVSDKSKLAKEPFFAGAQEGDKVLIYGKVGKVVLYRPSIGRVVETTTVSQPTPTLLPQLTEARLAIYNGTNQSGLATVAEAKIVKDFKNLKVVKKDNSVGEYQKTMVIVLDRRAMNLGQQLGSFLKAEVSDMLPAGEPKPEAEIVVILGEGFN